MDNNAILLTIRIDYPKYNSGNSFSFELYVNRFVTLKQLTEGIRHLAADHLKSLAPLFPASCAADIKDVIERLFELAEPRDVMLQCFFGNQSYVQPECSSRMAHYNMGAFEQAFIEGSLFVRDIRSLWHESGKPMTKFNLYFASEEEKARFTENMGDMDLCVTGCIGIGYEISPKGVG